MKTIAILADFPWSYFDAGAVGRGGGQACTWLAQIAEQFTKTQTYRIHWISIDRGSFSGRVTTRQWANQIFTRIPGGNARLDLLSGFRISKWLLGRELRKIRPDLLHCWGTERSYPIVCGSYPMPSILSMQGILTEYARIGSFAGNAYWTRLAAWEPRFLKSATMVTAESQWGLDRVREAAPGTDVRMVEYGVHPSFFELTWSPDTAQPYALYSGSIDQRKGVDILIDAVAEIPNRNWRLKMAGDGPLRPQLEARQVPGVEWLGVLDWKAMQHELSHAICVVLPTKADTSPNVSKEARVVGLPVITTQHGGQAGYIEDGVNGFIVNPLDSHALAKALSVLMGNFCRAKDMGAARHAIDREYFLPEHTANGFLAIYSEMLNSGIM